MMRWKRRYEEFEAKHQAMYKSLILTCDQLKAKVDLLKYKLHKRDIQIKNLKSQINKKLHSSSKKIPESHLDKDYLIGE